MKLLDGLVLRPLCNTYIVTGEDPSRVDFSKVISLNASAAYLWEQVLGREFTAEELVSLLTARYDVPQETAAADVQTLLKNWREAGLLEE